MYIMLSVILIYCLFLHFEFLLSNGFKKCKKKKKKNVGWVAYCCPSLDVRQPRVVRKLTYMNGKCQNVDCFYCIFLCFLLCQNKISQGIYVSFINKMK